MNPGVETEVKLRAADAGAAQAAVEASGARLVRARYLEDNLMFDHPGGRLRSRGEALRLRRMPHGGLLTFKGPKRVDDGVKVRREIELQIGDPDALEALLGAIGLERFYRYQKYRTEYRLGGLAVTLDETPVGVFLELEGEVDEIRARVEAFGYSSDDFVADSYVELFFASGGSGDMVFPETR